MRALNSPSRASARDELALAVKVYSRSGVQKGFEASDAQLDAIVALYDQYDQAKGAPADGFKGGPFPDELKTAVHDGYGFTQSGGKLHAIRTRLMQGVKSCPICGIDPPRELDHYLPKSTYKPLAVYVRNLVPLCHECNQSKGSTVSPLPNRQFIHPYFAELPDIDFIGASIALSDGGLVVQYGLDPGAILSDELRERLNYQFERLRLNERYQPEINTYMTSQTTALHLAFKAGDAAGVREYLRTQAVVEQHANHRNHWKPALLKALANHTEFCAGGFKVVLPPPPNPLDEAAPP